jgi:hypothetical protein
MNHTTDVWFASFLMIKEYPIVKFDIIRKGRGRYYFDLDSDQWAELKLQFHNSDVSKIKMHQITLKDLIH